MKDKIRILVAGGDMRQVYCAGKLSAIYDTYVMGFSAEAIPEKMNLKKAVTDTDGFYDFAVLPVPPLDENAMITAPCSSEKINPEEIRRLLKPDGIVFVGKYDGRLSVAFDGLEIIDYMEREDLSLKNAVPTAEGAVEIALSELPVTLNGLKVLIVGLGRIGTALAEILKGFGADVTASVRNARGTAKARILGIKSVCTDKMNTDYALVFNTVPEMIFNNELLEKFGDDTLFIDLASKPGGIDFKSATVLGKKVVWALGIPGKTAPVTSGEFIAETVAGIIDERGFYK
ncbi:MAG: dipicolinate synthase subunit A [Ruminococcus flavefaciens]|nr:dipicolinate synthase subunit A [Ruminococcus flavefaciens]